jgi:hypothetical protein
MFDFCSKYFSEKFRMQRLCLLLLCTYYHLSQYSHLKTSIITRRTFSQRKIGLVFFFQHRFFSFRESIECKELLLEAMRYHLLPEQRSSLSTERTTSRKPDGMKNYVFAIGEACNIELWSYWSFHPYLCLVFNGFF